MPVESVTYIDDLNATNPVGATDPKSQGDDHIRNIKLALKNTFPNIDGAVTASVAEMNLLDGLTTSTAELNLLDGLTANFTELNYLDGATGVTGTGNTVRSASPTFTGTINAAVLTASGAISGSNLSSAGGANPSASVGLNAVNGSATTFMRSDGAPALSQSIAPTWTGLHQYAPASGDAIRLTNAANEFGMRITGSSTNGQSFGPLIRAGTTSADAALTVQNQSGGSSYLVVAGDGGVTVGAPTGGNKGAGSINAAGGLYADGVQVSADIPRRTSGFARGQCLATAAGVTLNTSDMAAGYAFTLYNDSASAITLTQGSGVTLRLGGTTTTGNRTVAPRGIATIWCNSGTEAIVSGNVS